MAVPRKATAILTAVTALLLTLAISGHAAARPQVLLYKKVIPKAQTFGRYAFPAGTEITMQKGTVYRGKQYPDSFYAAKLTAPRRFYDIVWLKGTVVEFSGHEEPIGFAMVKGQAVQDFVAPDDESSITYWDGGFQDIRGTPAVERQLHKNGRTKSRKLLASEDIRGLELAANSEVLYHPNGKLMSATLNDKEQKLKTFTLAAGSKVVFYASGKLMKANLAEEAIVQGVHAIGPISFYEDGKLFAVTLADDVTIADHAYSEYSRLTLKPDGTVRGSMEGGRRPKDDELPFEPIEPAYP